MVNWLLAGLAVYLSYVYIAALLYLPQVGVARHVRGRDNLPEPSLLAGRAQRAVKNYEENLPFFLTLGILVMVVQSADTTLAESGALVFVLARIAYFPLYLSAIPLARSSAYGVSLVGLGMMVAALL